MSTTTVRAANCRASTLIAAPPAAKFFHHLRRDGGRVGAHTLARDAVIGCHDDDRPRRGGERGRAVDRSQPHGDLLEPAKASLRLRLLVEKALHHSRHLRIGRGDPRG
jgi:hypothetical protein